jgi:Domain of unknown function (DUF397)
MESTDMKWRKSSYSSNGGANCVEVGQSAGAVIVRDTTDRSGPALTFSRAAWRKLAGSVKTRDA